MCRGAFAFLFCLIGFVIRLEMQIPKIFIPLMILSLGFLANSCRGDSSDDLASYSRSLHEEFPDVQTISTAELAVVKKVPVLLDVRTEKEFAVSHLPGAVQAEKDVAEQLLKMGVPKDREIVVYCSVGYRSAQLAEKLSAAGFLHVLNLEGSIFAWTNEGRSLVNANGPTTGTHPYDRKWGRFLKKNHWQWKPETD